MKLIGFVIANWTWFLFGFIAIVASQVGLYEYAYHEGKRNCEAAQAAAQLKQDEKTKGDYRNVDRKTPYGADRATRIKWLREQVVRE